ncbi:3-oxoacyl-[acyl-carrier protein] reductase/L-fucose dehydrogenase [Gelidibacter sediminis]|uniref:3-oxoacyl-[acyl-carrier protein] reductase/L-fucose dehydrogenase n=1 Tax=Gelidibacter sediminis TaxID=1608710 RepID=A0A4R7PX14_9FLAO|nr:SDR family oxidoreductase [Gelidibacter sediminis]TDU39493.1 3-oxoacyl-[acyl-carrier protein] reductase/L-fucose dehydrogenase [Gelidibacter sediminis]
MDLKLKDKVIIVTGGSKGIGNGICNLLAQEGAIPVIVGRTESDVLEAVKTIKDNGGRVFHAIAELTNKEECKQAVEKVIKEFGRIDGLVNNAGVNDGVGLEFGNYDDFMRSIQRNVAHYYAMAQYALPELKKSKGAIINIGSKTSVTGQGGTSGYAAANGARNALTREWALELLPYRIRVNAVIVAECDTPQYASWLKTFPNPEERLAEITKNIPLENRMTTTAEIANTVAFLVSEVSSHTTGQLVFVDGGYTHLDRAL